MEAEADESETAMEETEGIHMEPLVKEEDEENLPTEPLIAQSTEVDRPEEDREEGLPPPTEAELEDPGVTSHFLFFDFLNSFSSHLVVFRLHWRMRNNRKVRKKKMMKMTFRLLLET